MKEKMLTKVLNKEMKLYELADHFSVTRKTASKWLAKFRYGGISELVPKKSGPKSGTCWNRTHEDIEELVVAVAQQNPFKGPVWISNQLEEQGVTIDQSTVYRILKRRKIRYYTNYKHKRRKKKAYCLDSPGREIQLDCCFPWGYQKDAIVYDCIDDCSRWVFGRVLKNHTAESTVEFLQELMEKAPFTITAIRTDQGKEFLNATVKKFLQDHNIEHKINPPYTPQHNGKIERFHQTLKNDAIMHNWSFHDNLTTLNYKLELYLKYYNYKRRHTGLGMNKLTPIQKIAYVMLQSSFDQNVTLTLQQNKY